MSSTLTIEPLIREKVSLSLNLKFTLQKRNGNHTTSNWIVSEKDIPYFEGLRDAEIDDADTVISMIEKYGECVLTEDF